MKLLTKISLLLKVTLSKIEEETKRANSLETIKMKKKNTSCWSIFKF